MTAVSLLIVIECYSSPRHEVAEAAGLISHSFGVEDVDKHIVLFKKVATRTTIFLQFRCSWKIIHRYYFLAIGISTI